MMLLVLVFLAFPSWAAAHGGGLDARGGHVDRSTGRYHCHRPAFGCGAGREAEWEGGRYRDYVRRQLVIQRAERERRVAARRDADRRRGARERPDVAGRGVPDGVLQRGDYGDYAAYQDWLFLAWTSGAFGASVKNEAGLVFQVDCDGGWAAVAVREGDGGPILVRAGRAATLGGVSAGNLARHLLGEAERGVGVYEVSLRAGGSESFSLAGAGAALRRMAEGCGLDVSVEWVERVGAPPPPDAPGGGIVAPERGGSVSGAPQDGGGSGRPWVGMVLALVGALAVVVVVFGGPRIR